MSDTLALTRLCFLRTRKLLLAAIALLVGLHLAVIVGSFGGPGATDILIPCYVIAIIPLCLASIALFDAGIGGDLSGETSGYHAWLIRSPIPAWKLAVIPIAMKAAWVALLWAFVAVTCAVFLNEPDVAIYPIPALALLSIATWVCYVSWRPFSGLLPRLLISIVLMLGGYVGMAFSIGVTIGIDDFDVSEQRLRTLTGIAVVAILGWGVWSCIRAIKLARINVGGIIAESKSGNLLTRLVSPDLRRDYSLTYLPTVTHGPLQAMRSLVKFENARSRIYLYRAVLFGWIPCILLHAFLIPAHFATAFTLLVAALCIASMSNAKQAYREQKDSRELLPLVVSSPISTATLAWSRMIGVFVNWTVLFGGVLITLFCWSLRPMNQETWNRFAAAMTERYGNGTAAVQISIALLLVSYLIYLSFPLRSTWVDLLGRGWVTILYAVTVGLIPLVIIGAVSRFMWRQTSWEDAAAEAIGYAEYLPAIGVSLLIAKLVATAVTSIALVRQQLAYISTTIVIFVAWLMLTLLLGVTLAALVPESWASVSRMNLLAALVIPLPTILGAPLALARSRHR